MSLNITKNIADTALEQGVSENGIREMIANNQILYFITDNCYQIPVCQFESAKIVMTMQKVISHYGENGLGLIAALSEKQKNYGNKSAWEVLSDSNFETALNMLSK